MGLRGVDVEMARNGFTKRLKPVRKPLFHLVGGIFAVFMLPVSYAYAGLPAAVEWNEWCEVSPAINAEITCVENIQGMTELYVGTEEGLYRTENAGRDWQRQMLPHGNFEIRDIVLTDGSLFIATKRGVYAREETSLWRCLFNLKNIAGITVGDADGERNVFAWCGKDLFLIKRAGWKRIGPKFLKYDISDVLCRGGVVFVSSGRDIFVLSEKGEIWKKYGLPGVSDLSESEEISDDDVYIEEGSEIPEIRHLGFFEKDKIFAAVRDGIYVFDGRGKFLKQYARETFSFGDIQRVLYSGKHFFAADDNAVYRYAEKTKLWDVFFRKTFPGEISALMEGLDEKGRPLLWVASGRNLYKKSLDLFFEIEETLAPKRFHIFPKEITPSINCVHEMAIDYAEVSPEKIKAWRRRAKWKAILPKCSVGFSESIDENIEIYKSASTAYVVTGPEEKGVDWDIGLNWDFSELIWTSSETTIDIRSKLMVQLREDILEDVTRLYFERKRLVSEIVNIRENSFEKEAMTDRISEKMLRVEELTAYIDALTGGKFSEEIKLDR
ncbi:MAG: hypothetical protein ISS33_01705 [Candidatus Omnitrophica bacterium]|nr:hypothetical protein [Candidatus Omnitrophota bacterium]